MDGMDFKELGKKMEELEYKASRYDEFKEEVNKIMEKINIKFNEIQELLSEINPMISLSKKFKVKGVGNKTVDYIEKCYKYLIDHPDEEMSMRSLREAVDLGHIIGGSEYAVKVGIKKLPGIKFSVDPQNQKRHLLKFMSTADINQELFKDLPRLIKEIVKNGKSKVKIDDDDETLKNAIPKKVSHMG